MSVAAALLALTPAAAAAQSAGDEQYEDPFSDEQAQATPAPAAPAQATATPAPAQPAATAPPPVPAAAPQLPRSGEDALVPGALGVILLAAGVALCVRVRRAP